MEQREGLTGDSALSYMRQTDRDRAARVRFSYGVELGDPLLYDLVLDTERLDVVHCARLIEKTLEHERFRSTTESLRAMQDQSLLAQARAALAFYNAGRQSAWTCK